MMPLYSFSRRQLFKQCPLAYAGVYETQPRPPKVDTDPMMVGRIADDFVELLLAAGASGEVTSIEGARAFVQNLVNDWESGDGITESIAQDAAFVVFSGLRGPLKQAMDWIRRADEWHTQLPLWFTDEWTQLVPPDGETFARGSTYGGILDFAAVKGRHARVVDWKTGSSRWKKPQQIEEYALYMFEAYDVDEIEVFFGWLKEGFLDPQGRFLRSDVEDFRDRIAAEVASIEQTEDRPARPGKPQCLSCATPCEKRIKL